jgi:uncharacterized protein (DUF1501 family)
MKKSDHKPTSPSRRGFLRTAGIVVGGVAAPWVWVPKLAYAQTAARGSVRHLLYIRLSGGFRFTAAFNGNTADEFNPFGRATGLPSGTEWSPSQLVDRSNFLSGTDGQARAALGMQKVTAFANEIAVVPCVDHEPLSGNADGNHGTGLERYYTGYVGGNTSFFTMINYGLREQVAQAIANGETPLPAVSFGDGGMAMGFGAYAAYRPPVIQSDGFENFGFDATTAVPAWATNLTNGMDTRLRDKLHPAKREVVDSYIQSREATTRYSAIFNDDALKIGQNSPTPVDGLSNADLNRMFGQNGTGRNIALALRLFHFGCPAAYINEGAYDLHSNEEGDLPPRIDGLNQLISATRTALQVMAHPRGGTYWDHTLVVFGSEFGRTTGGNRFNSARGSDHGGDLATRWMSMPMMGGLITSAGVGGRSFGSTRRADLVAEGSVYSYRALTKTLLDYLGADHAEFFPADMPIGDFVG